MIDIEKHTRAVAGALHELGRRLHAAQTAGVTLEVLLVRGQYLAVPRAEGAYALPADPEWRVHGELTVKHDVVVGADDWAKLAQQADVAL